MSVTPRVGMIVIGAGPAGLGAALSSSSHLDSILLLEAGRNYSKRPCPVDNHRACAGCGGSCNVVAGFGGCVHYGDGVKLSRFPSGRRLAELLGDQLATELAGEAEHLLSGGGDLRFRASAESVPGFTLKTYDICTLGEGDVRKLVQNLHDRVTSNPKIDLQCGVEVVDVRREEDCFRVTCRARNKSDETSEFEAENVVVAVGRHGRRWWRKAHRSLGVDYALPTPSVGIRFELPARYTAPLEALHADFKTSVWRHDTKVKTFCLCAGPGGGQIKFTDYGDFTLLDGHVSPEANRASSNFALLAQLFDEDGSPASEEWIEQNILRRYKFLRPERPGKPVIQRYTDFRDKILRCTDFDTLKLAIGFSPSLSDYGVANLAGIIPDAAHRAFCSVFEEIIALCARECGVNIDEIISQTAVIGLELESMWDEITVSKTMQSSVPGLYVCGDSNGLAQGIVQSMVSGLAVSRGLNRHDRTERRREAACQ